MSNIEYIITEAYKKGLSKIEIANYLVERFIISYKDALEIIEKALQE